MPAPSTCNPLYNCHLRSGRAGNSKKQGRYLENPGTKSPFCFAPGLTPNSDAPKICWKVRNTDRFKEVKLELFCKGRTNSIWEMVWDQQALGTNLRVGELSAGTKTNKDNQVVPIQWSGSLDWNSTVQIDKQLKFNLSDTRPAFPDGILTVEHSPYQLRMTINGGDEGTDKMGYPLVAWTYVHILVHEIKLSYGTDNVIPTNRTDISDANNRTEMLAQEKRILADLRQNNLSLSPDGTQPTATHDIVLNATRFNYDESTEFTYYRNCWGNGPLIPLFAEATIKKADKLTGVLLPEALGHTKFLWEWQDNDGESRDNWLKRWVGDKTDLNNKVSPITHYYLDEIHKAFQNAAYPHHAFNCPAKAGGKRGAQSPKPTTAEKVTTLSGANLIDYVAAPVFPEQTGNDIFPFKVAHEFQKRNWAAVSYLGKIVGNTAQTGVLFQPAAISGDRYKITTYLLSDQQPNGSSDGYQRKAG